MPAEKSVFFAVPFYSGYAYLKDCLDSLGGQGASWQAAVIDDSGTAEGEKFVTELLTSLNDPRIRYIKHGVNRGIGATWNRGLTAAQEAGFAKVTILHEDDRLEIGYAAAMVEAFRQVPDATFIYPQVRIIDADGEHVMPFRDRYRFFARPRSLKNSNASAPYVLEGAHGLARLLRSNFFYCPAICYDLAQLNGERFREDLATALDFEMYCRLLLKGKKLVALATEPMFDYRRHGTSTTEVHSRTQRKFDEERQVYRFAGSEARKRGWRAATFWSQVRPTWRLHRAYRAIFKRS